MSKGKGGGGGNAAPPSWSSLAGTAASKLAGMFIPGGYTTQTPGRDQGGTWLAMGEPSAGGTVQQNGIMWGGNAYSASPSLLTSIMIESPRQELAQNAAPLFQRLTIAILDGQVDVGNALVTAGGSVVGDEDIAVTIGIGMYMAKFNPDTNLYGVQDPLSSADVSRFNWIYLESRTVIFSTDASAGLIAGPVSVISSPKIWDVYKGDFNQVLGPGEALMFACRAVSLGSNSALTLGNVELYPAIRAFLTRGS